MTIMLRKEQRAASGEGKTARKFQSNYHMITVGGKWAVTGRSGQIRPPPTARQQVIFIQTLSLPQ